MILLSQTSLFAIVAIVLMFVALLYAFGTALHSQTRQSEVASEVARQFGASITGDGWKSFQWFTFEREGHTIHVRIDKFQTKNNLKAAMVQVRIPWPEATARMIIYPETVPDKLKKFIGLEDIVIGSPHFDSQFIIQGNRDTLSELLSRDVQRLMSGISSGSVSHNAHFSIVHSGFYVRKRIPLNGFTGLAVPFIESSLRLHRMMLKSGQAAVGVTFIETSIVREVKSDGTILKTHPTCLVCGDDIVQQKVVCKSCKTPHHFDCWTYIGQCSVYGCGQQLFKSGR